MADQCFHINGAWLHMDLHRLRSIPIRPRLPHTGGSNTPAKPLANSDPQQDLAARDIPLGLRATVLAIPMLGRSTTLLCLLPNLNRTAEMVITQWQVSRLILKMSTRSQGVAAMGTSPKPRGGKRYRQRKLVKYARIRIRIWRRVENLNFRWANRLGEGLAFLCIAAAP